MAVSMIGIKTQEQKFLNLFLDTEKSMKYAFHPEALTEYAETVRRFKFS